MLCLSHLLHRHLARWGVCALLFAASLMFFLWLVPNGVAAVTANRTLAPRILNEYIMTWGPDDARAFLNAIGPQGREAYRRFYLDLDFWFPVLTLALWYASLLSLAFPASSRFATLNLLPFAMWISNAAENINHFTMASRYPDLPSLSLSIGPAFTFVKWTVLFASPLLALVGFAFQMVGPRKRVSRVAP